MIDTNMGIIENVISYIKEQVGVVDVFVMDDDMSKDVDSIEKSIKTRTNHDYVNIGYDMALEREHRLCLFITKAFEREFRTRLVLMTGDGTIMGMNLMQDEIEEYSKRDDVLFVSNDFVVFPEEHGEGEEMFVLYPYEFKELEDMIPGCRDAIGFFPTPSSDAYLKERFGLPIDQFIFSTLIAFNG